MKQKMKFLFCLISVSALALAKDNEKYYKILIEALNSERNEVVLETLKIIPDLKDDSFKPYLKKLVEEHKNERIKIKSIAAMIKMNDKSYLDSVYKIAMTKIPDLRELPLLERPKAVKIEGLKLEAIKILGDNRIVAAIPILKNIVSKERGRTADEAYVSLAKLGDRSGIEIFYRGLRSRDYLIKIRACEVLGEIREIQATKAIRKLLKDWNKEVRIKAIEALGKIGDVETAPLISNFLNDDEAAFRAAACEALGSIGDKKYIKPLKKMLDDPNGYVRLLAVEALMKLGEKPDMQTLEDAIDSPDSEVQLRCLRIISRFRVKKFLNFLEKNIDKTKNDIIKINMAYTILKLKGEK